MYLQWFINSDKCTTLMQDVHNREEWGRVEEGVGGSSVLPVQFFCRLKTALKNKVD